MDLFTVLLWLNTDYALVRDKLRTVVYTSYEFDNLTLYHTPLTVPSVVIQRNGYAYDLFPYCFILFCQVLRSSKCDLE